MKRPKQKTPQLLVLVFFYISACNVEMGKLRRKHKGAYQKGRDLPVIKTLMQ